MSLPLPLSLKVNFKKLVIVSNSMLILLRTPGGGKRLYSKNKCQCFKRKAEKLYPTTYSMHQNKFQPSEGTKETISSGRKQERIPQNL